VFDDLAKELRDHRLSVLIGVATRSAECCD
jgi:hypothetical protein